MNNKLKNQFIKSAISIIAMLLLLSPISIGLNINYKNLFAVPDVLLLSPSNTALAQQCAPATCNGKNAECQPGCTLNCGIGIMSGCAFGTPVCYNPPPMGLTMADCIPETNDCAFCSSGGMPKCCSGKTFGCPSSGYIAACIDNGISPRCINNTSGEFLIVTGQCTSGGMTSSSSSSSGIISSSSSSSSSGGSSSGNMASSSSSSSGIISSSSGGSSSGISSTSSGTICPSCLQGCCGAKLCGGFDDVLCICENCPNPSDETACSSCQTSGSSSGGSSSGSMASSSSSSSGIISSSSSSSSSGGSSSGSMASSSSSSSGIISSSSSSSSSGGSSSGSMASSSSSSSGIISSSSSSSSSGGSSSGISSTSSSGSSSCTNTLCSSGTPICPSGQSYVCPSGSSPCCGLDGSCLEAGCAPNDNTGGCSTGTSLGHGSCMIISSSSSSSGASSSGCTNTLCSSGTPVCPSGQSYVCPSGSTPCCGLDGICLEAGCSDGNSCNTGTSLGHGSCMLVSSSSSSGGSSSGISSSGASSSGVISSSSSSGVSSSGVISSSSSSGVSSSGVISSSSSSGASSSSGVISSSSSSGASSSSGGSSSGGSSSGICRPTCDANDNVIIPQGHVSYCPSGMGTAVYCYQGTAYCIDTEANISYPNIALCGPCPLCPTNTNSTDELVSRNAYIATCPSSLGEAFPYCFDYNHDNNNDLFCVNINNSAVSENSAQCTYGIGQCPTCDENGNIKVPGRYKAGCGQRGFIPTCNKGIPGCFNPCTKEFTGYTARCVTSSDTTLDDELLGISCPTITTGFTSSGGSSSGCSSGGSSSSGCSSSSGTINSTLQCSPQLAQQCNNNPACSGCLCEGGTCFCFPYNCNTITLAGTSSSSGSSTGLTPNALECSTEQIQHCGQFPNCNGCHCEGTVCHCAPLGCDITTLINTSSSSGSSTNITQSGSSSGTNFNINLSCPIELQQHCNQYIPNCNACECEGTFCHCAPLGCDITTITGTSSSSGSSAITPSGGDSGSFNTLECSIEQVQHCGQHPNCIGCDCEGTFCHCIPLGCDNGGG